MNNIELARSNIRQAEERLKHAKEALESGNYPYVMRQCQEAVELALKAALRLTGIEPPKWHDVGPVLKRERNVFPDWFQRHTDELASISRILRREREPALYGDEETGISPEELYAKSDAENALKDAENKHFPTSISGLGANYPSFTMLQKIHVGRRVDASHALQKRSRLPRILKL